MFGKNFSQLFLIPNYSHLKSPVKRSLWKIEIQGSRASIEGLLRIQVHYYEDGNVQLLSKKDCEHEMSVESDSKFATELTKFVKNAENEYQASVRHSNYCHTNAFFVFENRYNGLFGIFGLSCPCNVLNESVANRSCSCYQ